MDSFLQAITAPSSGPFWGLMGIVVTQIVNIVVVRKKSATDIASSHLTAVNEASKTLIEGLFRQVKEQGEQIDKLQAHAELCEKQHREALEKILGLQRQMMGLQEEVANSNTTAT